ncbi:phosphotransferase [Sinomonas albida]|uniref:phosphotransferase n=1 Tax=Sinomonas albida TaxID=369942 RepID=UPI003019A11C
MEEILSGGNMNEVVRVGGTVRRRGGPWTSTVHEVLRGLRSKGISWVPSVYGIDEVGREILEFLPGIVPSYPLPEWVWHDSFLIDAATRLRQLHDATVGLAVDDAVWQGQPHEPAEVICHNDFAPYNFACTDGRITGVIDWDFMSPGPRVWDVAYLAYRLCPLAGPKNPDHRPGDSAAEQGRRLKLLLDAYGAQFTAADVLGAVVLRLDELARFTDSEAERRNSDDLAGHVAIYRNDIDYIAAAKAAILSGTERCATPWV